MRSDINRPKLVRLLGAWSPAPADAFRTDFAERLGRWLNAFDAVGLQAAHQSIRAIRTTAPAKAGVAPVRPEALAADLQRVRSTLAHAVAQDPLQFAIPKLARPAPGERTALPTEVDAGYAPWQQRHLKLQRQMEQMVAPLRDHARQLLSQASPRLRQLAALDAVLEQALSRREQMHLPAVATLMQRRFDALRREHQQAAAAAAALHEDEGTSQAGAWRDAFRKEWTQVLLAELDLRLEPVAGLIDALAND